MTPDWQQFLADSGFTVSDTGEPAVGSTGAAQSKATLVDASKLAVVEISGEETFDFFQAQTCNDLSQIGPSDAQLNGYCNPKGRLLALFTVLKVDAGFLLIVPKEVADGFIKRLTMFVLRAKVVIKRRDDLQVAGLLLESDSVADGQAIGSVKIPTGSMSVTVENSEPGNEHVRIGYPSHPEASDVRVLMVGTTAAIREDWLVIKQSVGADSTGIATYEAWRAADIVSARASIVHDTIESFIPQMVNLQLIDGLSFKKGCYPGQEIVARMQYLGKLKRHMRWFSLAADVVPPPGARLENSGDADAGIVVDAVQRIRHIGWGAYALIDNVGDRVDVLAVIKIDKAQDEFTLAGVNLLAEAMPYELVQPE